jgi:hypothetical protein
MSDQNNVEKRKLSLANNKLIDQIASSKDPVYHVSVIVRYLKILKRYRKDIYEVYINHKPLKVNFSSAFITRRSCFIKRVRLRIVSLLDTWIEDPKLTYHDLVHAIGIEKVNKNALIVLKEDNFVKYVELFDPTL